MLSLCSTWKVAGQMLGDWAAAGAAGISTASDRRPVAIRERRRDGRIPARYRYGSGVGNLDSFGARATLQVGGTTHEIFRLDALQSQFDVVRLPYSRKILLENLWRNADGESVTRQDIENVATWVATDEPSKEIAYSPSRVLM